MKTHRTIAVVFTFSSLIILPLIFQLVPLKAAASPGRLVFTDLAKPNHSYTVDIYDLESNTRSPLPRVGYKDVGMLALIDEQFMYASVCPIFGKSMFCQTYFNGIFAPEDIRRIDTLLEFWKLEYGSPHWSPDGTRIAFQIRNETPTEFQYDTYVMNADGTNILDLTPDEDNSGFSLAWSPDSQQIAFVCRAEQSLCISNADGNKLQRIDAPPNLLVRDLTWSPDGSRIAFALLESDVHNSELYLVNADGSNLRRLVEAAPNFHRQPIWSPDGSKIAFWSNEAKDDYNGEIYVIQADGTDLQNISSSLDGHEFGVTWSPDSQSVAFFSSQHDRGMFLYIACADGTDLRQLIDNGTWGVDDGGSPVVFWLP